MNSTTRGHNVFGLKSAHWTDYLVFVGGVEGDLSNLGVFVPHVLDGAAAQLNTLQQGSF